MKDYEVGFGKPPKHTRFKKGVCPNPKGRGAKKDGQFPDVASKFMTTKIDYVEDHESKRASRNELSIKRLVGLAIKGDVASADQLLKVRAHAEKHGDTGPLVIELINALPDWPPPADGPAELRSAD